MEDLVELESLSNDEQALLGFALAAVSEAQAASTWRRRGWPGPRHPHSAAKAARGLTFDPEINTRLIDQIKRVFTREFIARRQGWGIADHRPVFIVGLPRSGTTLTEQILASHPNVHGAGELDGRAACLQDAAVDRRAAVGRGV